MSKATIRKGQTHAAFGDVVRLVRDRVDPEDSGLERYVAGEHMDTDDLKIRSWGLIGDGYLGPAFNMRFKPGHVLYGSRRTYLRKVALTDFEGICANTTFVLETKDPKVLLPELLPFVMQTETFHKHSIKQSKGSVNPYVNFSDLAWYEFALPALEEQRQIAESLIAIDSTLNAFRLVEERVLAGKVRLAMDLGHRATSLAASGNGEELRTIRDLCDSLDSRRVPLNEAERAAIPGDIPYYGATGQIDSVGRHLFEEDIILVAEDGGPFNEFDRKPVAYLVTGKSWVNNHAHVLRTKDKKMQKWVFANLVHRDLRRFTSGSTRGKLNKAKLLQVPIWVPDFDTRANILAGFENFAHAEALIRQRAERLSLFRTKFVHACLASDGGVPSPSLERST